MTDIEIPLAEPVINEAMITAAQQVLRNEYFLQGESVTEFETAFAEFVGTKHAVAVDSGTRALHFSLQALDVDDGQTVITTPATFIATANAIRMAGATPKFVDISLDTYTIDFDALVEALESEEDIGAVVPVHLYGYPVDVDRLREIVGDIPIVSDACQAHGGGREGARVGSKSTSAAFSFYPSKNMTVAGDGGMIVTDDSTIAERARMLRDVGRGEDSPRHEIFGHTARLNTVNAAIGSCQLDHLEAWNERREEIAKQYSRALVDVGDLLLPPRGDNSVSPAWYLYVVRTQQREGLAAFLDEKSIETGIHYPTPVHLQPPYRRMGYKEGMFPKSERWAKEVLSLPIHPSLTNSQVEHVIDSIIEYFNEDFE